MAEKENEMDLHYRVKFLTYFKDGNILEKAVSAGTILILRKDLYEKCLQSGAEMEQLETLVPNPAKHKEEQPEEVEHDVRQPVAGQEPEAEAFTKKYERWAEEDGEPKNENTVLVKRKRGRPRKAQ